MVSDGKAVHIELEDGREAIQYRTTHPPDQRRRLNAGTFREAWKVEESDHVPVYQMTKMPEPRKMKMLNPQDFAQMCSSPFSA